MYQLVELIGDAARKYEKHSKRKDDQQLSIKDIKQYAQLLDRSVAKVSLQDELCCRSIMSDLSRLYEYRDIIKDNKRAHYWTGEYIARTKKAAARGDMYAMFGMGLLYENYLLGKQSNFKLAKQWYEKAAAKGLTRAMYTLGNLYLTGSDKHLPKQERVEKDFQLAIKWFKKAALNYDFWATEAMFSLGYFYQYGDPSGDNDFKPNKQKAIEWYQKAANRGHQESKKALEKLK
jgi:TPR repeat protein